MLTTLRVPACGTKPSGFGRPGGPFANLLSGCYLFHNTGTGRVANLAAQRNQSPPAGLSTDLTQGFAGYQIGRMCFSGKGAYFNGSGYLNGGNPSQAYQSSTGSTPGWTLMIRFRLASTAAARGIVSLGGTATDTQPAYLLQCNSSTSIRALMTDGAYATILSSPSTGVWYTVASTYNTVMTNGATGTEQHFVGTNGRMTKVVDASRTGGTANGANLFVASGFNGAQAMDVEFLYIWDRKLSYGEIAAYAAQPYRGFLRETSTGYVVSSPPPPPPSNSGNLLLLGVG